SCVPAALERYQTARKPIVEKLIAAAKTSAGWYEHFAEHMKMKSMDFAYSYITRSGRINPARLKSISPRFSAQHQAWLESKSKRASA
ncbi:MAG: hypothetical protein AB7O50_10580, partial [Pseudolabrys sp.]